MKKGISLFVFAVVVTTFTFGADMSWGLNFRTGPVFLHETMTGGMHTGKNPDGPVGVGKDYMADPSVGIAADEHNWFPLGFIGADVFLDLKYVVVGAGILVQPYDSKDSPGDMTGGPKTSLNLSLLGKIPFKINDRFTLFPLLGAEYELMLAMTDDYGNTWTRSDKDKEYDGGKVFDDYGALAYQGNYADVTAGARYDNLWIKVGIGGDIAISDRVFFRNELLWGIRLESTWDKENLQAKIDSSNGKYNFTRFTHGFTCKMAIGFKLGKAAPQAQTPAMEPETAPAAPAPVRPRSTRSVQSM